MVIGIARVALKKRNCRFGEDKAAGETDRLQIVIYVAGGSLNELRWGCCAACDQAGDQLFNGERVAGLQWQRDRYGSVNRNFYHRAKHYLEARKLYLEQPWNSFDFCWLLQR